MAKHLEESAFGRLASLVEEDVASESDEKKTVHSQLAFIAKTLGYDLTDAQSGEAFFAAVKAAVTTQKPQLMRAYGRMSASREKKNLAQLKRGI